MTVSFHTKSTIVSKSGSPAKTTICTVSRGCPRRRNQTKGNLLTRASRVQKLWKNRMSEKLICNRSACSLNPLNAQKGPNTLTWPFLGQEMTDVFWELAISGSTSSNGQISVLAPVSFSPQSHSALLFLVPSHCARLFFLRGRFAWDCTRRRCAPESFRPFIFGPRSFHPVIFRSGSFRPGVISPFYFWPPVISPKVISPGVVAPWHLSFFCFAGIARVARISQSTPLFTLYHICSGITQKKWMFRGKTNGTKKKWISRRKSTGL